MLANQEFGLVAEQASCEWFCAWIGGMAGRDVIERTGSHIAARDDRCSSSSDASRRFETSTTKFFGIRRPHTRRPTAACRLTCANATMGQSARTAAHPRLPRSAVVPGDESCSRGLRGALCAGGNQTSGRYRARMASHDDAFCPFFEIYCH